MQFLFYWPKRGIFHLKHHYESWNNKSDVFFIYYLCDFVVRDIKIAVYLESPLKINFNLVSTFLNKWNSRKKLVLTINKKTWEALNVYFSNKLQFERKLYYYRPGLTNRETKMTVVRMRSFIFWLKQEKPLALHLCE